MSKTRPAAKPAKTKPAAKPAKRVPLTPAQLKVARIKESRRLSAYILAHKELNKGLVKPALTEAAKRIVHKTHDKSQIDTIWYNIARTGAKLAVKQYGGIVENAVIRLTAQKLKESYGGSLTKATTARMIVEQRGFDDEPTDGDLDMVEIDDFDDEDTFEVVGDGDDDDFDGEFADLDGFEDAIEFDEEDYDDDEGYVPGRGRGGYGSDESDSSSYGGDRWRDPGSLGGGRRSRWD